MSIDSSDSFKQEVLHTSNSTSQGMEFLTKEHETHSCLKVTGNFVGRTVRAKRVS